MWIYDLELQACPAACIDISWRAICLKTADNFKIQDISLSVPFLELYVSLDLIDTFILWENASPRPVFVKYLLLQNV